MIMKYWKGRTGTNKEKQCGTMDDTGYVPDADECTKEEYDFYIALQPMPPTPTDYIALYAAAITDAQKIAVLAKKIGLI